MIEDHFVNEELGAILETSTLRVRVATVMDDHYKEYLIPHIY